LSTKTNGIVEPDGFMIEEVRQGDRLLLAVRSGGETFVTPSYEHRGCKYVPASQKEGDGFILPSEPAADPVETDELVRMCIRFSQRFWSGPEEFHVVAARYALLTWCYERFSDIPYLRVLGPGGTGKSRFLDVMRALCRRSRLMVSPTSPITYRTIEESRPTLILEEATDMSSMIFEILRAGMQKGRTVSRCEGEGRKVRKHYDTFGPKVVAAYHRYPDVPLEQRLITHFTAGYGREDGVPIRLGTRQAEFDSLGLGLRNMLLRWRFDNLLKVKDDGSLIEGLSDRANQVAGALLCLTPPGEHRDAIVQYVQDASARTQSDTSDSVEGNLAWAIMEALEEHPEVLPGGQRAVAVQHVVAAMPVELQDHRLVGHAAKRMSIKKARTKKKRYFSVSDTDIQILQRTYGLPDRTHMREDD
jgi:hypothetical protein